MPVPSIAIEDAYVIAIRILNTFQDVGFQLLDNGALLIRQDKFNGLFTIGQIEYSAGIPTHFLHNATTVHLHRQGKHMSFHRAC